MAHSDTVTRYLPIFYVNLELIGILKKQLLRENNRNL